MLIVPRPMVDAVRVLRNCSMALGYRCANCEDNDHLCYPECSLLWLAQRHHVHKRDEALPFWLPPACLHGA